MTMSNLLYLITSWTNTVFIDSSYDVGYYLNTSSNGIASGVLLYTNVAISSMVSSLDLPTPAADLGCTDRIVSNITLVPF